MPDSLYCGHECDEYISYNYVVFNRGMDISISTSPVRDDADTTTQMMRLDVKVSGIYHTDQLTRTGGNSDGLHLTRLRLMEDGGDFQLMNIGGFDTASLVTFQGQKSRRSPVIIVGERLYQALRDTPRVELIEWEPLGVQGATAKLTWQATVFYHPFYVMKDVYGDMSSNTLPDQGGDEDQKVLLGKNYEVSWSVDDKGRTTRTVSGYIETHPQKQFVPWPNVPQTMLWVQRSADWFRSRIQIQLLPGFKRDQQYTLSADRRRLNFVISDKEIESSWAIPKGLAEISGKTSVNWNHKTGALTHHISVQMVRREGVHPWQCVVYFQMIMNAIISGVSAYKGREERVIESLDIEHDLWGYTTSFNCAMRITGTVDQLIMKTGLFANVGSLFNWSDWAKEHHGARGYASCYYKGGEEALIMLERNVSGGVTWNNDTDRVYMSSVAFKAPYPKEPAVTPGNLKIPRKRKSKSVVDPTNGFLWFMMGVMNVSDHPVSVIRPIKEWQKTPDKFNPYGTSQQERDESYTSQNVIHQGGQPSHYVVIYGGAERVGYAPPLPQLAEIDGSACVEVKRMVDRTTRGNLGGAMVHVLDYKLMYAVAGNPTTVSPGDLVGKAFDPATFKPTDPPEFSF